MPTFIEVTVTNRIDEERLKRIRSKRELALEIDLSVCGGRVTYEELRRLVVEETQNKRWLFHPEVEERRTALLAQLEALAERRAAVLATPLDEVTRAYVDAVTARLRQYRNEDGPIASEGDLGEALADAVDKMSIRGFPEAGDSLLIESHGILDRILSIKADVGIGYRLHNGFGVLNAIRQSRGQHREYHSLFMIAAVVFAPRLSDSQQEWLDGWRAKVRDSIKAREETYLRPTTYDRILGVLFPEMAESLAKPGGKRGARASAQGSSHGTGPGGSERRPAYFLTMPPRSDGANWLLEDTKPDEFWLKGRDLERWRKQNPQWAQFWGPPAQE